MEGQWKFVPYKKKHDEGGFGYWIEGFDGEFTFIEYERERTKSGYIITHLDGTRVPYEDPKPEEEKKEPLPEDKFDAEKANQEAINDAAAKAEAELAGKIVGVAETKGDRKRREVKKDVDTTDEETSVEDDRDEMTE